MNLRVFLEPLLTKAPCPEKAAQRLENEDRKLVARCARGSVSLRGGRYITSADIDQKRRLLMEHHHA